MKRTFVLTAAMVFCGFSAWAESHAADAKTAETAEAVTMEQEVDLEAAEKIFRKSCRACHGNKAQGASSYPSLSDKEPAYIVEKLERYRAGEKFGPNSVLMIQHAKKLSDSDIVSLSVYVTTAFD
ncbi:c-type cytochrome [Thetidibacter halocola]|uniref:C-type cytochrome n=1 Tax=Thetidibacter halocola TaxID=2827239 RepID=A0A8J7W8L3_9RHOB|nr:c-type cytochrome [Thetidibacter halocola]MBS0122965.1 c-type cytochrome [Thetidibacter halocola]